MLCQDYVREGLAQLVVPYNRHKVAEKREVWPTIYR